jgi:hypothetical protein
MAIGVFYPFTLMTSPGPLVLHNRPSGSRRYGANKISYVPKRL